VIDRDIYKTLLSARSEDLYKGNLLVDQIDCMLTSGYLDEAPGIPSTRQ
jgi:hypothetical protein